MIVCLRSREVLTALFLLLIAINVCLYTVDESAFSLKTVKNIYDKHELICGAVSQVINKIEKTNNP